MKIVALEQIQLSYSMILKACYSPRYFAQTDSNSMQKLTAVTDVLAHNKRVDLLNLESIDQKFYMLLIFQTTLKH